MRRIKDFEDYSVTSCGKVWSHISNKWLKPCDNSKGYLCVGLHKNGKIYTKLIHRLVALAFIPKTEEDIKLNRDCIDHIDTNKLNNHVSNLRWCTAKENQNNPITRENISKGQKGKRLSEETKAKMSKSLLGNQRAKGYKHSEETREKVRKAMNRPEVKAKLIKAKSKPIIIDSVEYNSAKEAGEILGIKRGTIVKRLQSKNFPNYEYKGVVI